MTYDIMIFCGFQEQDEGMLVELGDGAMYLVKGLSFISFQMPLGGVLVLDPLLYVPNLTKSSPSVPCMENL